MAIGHVLLRKPYGSSPIRYGKNANNYIKYDISYLRNTVLSYTFFWAVPIKGNFRPLAKIKFKTGLFHKLYFICGHI